jgi:hypothetical protein
MAATVEQARPLTEQIMDAAYADADRHQLNSEGYGKNAQQRAAHVATFALTMATLISNLKSGEFPPPFA